MLPHMPDTNFIITATNLADSWSGIFNCFLQVQLVSLYCETICKQCIPAYIYILSIMFSPLMFFTINLSEFVDCRLKLVRTLFNIYNVMQYIWFYGRWRSTRSQFSYYYYRYHDVRGGSPTESQSIPIWLQKRLSAKNSKTPKLFTYSITDFYELWYIYIIALGMGSSVYMAQMIRKHYKLRRGHFVFAGGVRSSRTK